MTIKELNERLKEFGFTEDDTIVLVSPVVTTTGDAVLKYWNPQVKNFSFHKPGTVSLMPGRPIKPEELDA